MKHKNVKFLALFFLGLGITGLKAQEAIVTSGENATGSGGSASYSVGQIAYTTNYGTTGSVAQGVQQPYEISVVTAIKEAGGINLSVSVYPNPATVFLLLNVDASATLSIQSMSYQLFDMNGKLLQTKKLTGQETQIDMSSYMPAIYFVRVTKENKSVKEFKIIKN